MDMKGLTKSVSAKKRGVLVIFAFGLFHLSTATQKKKKKKKKKKIV